jgi:hypothetical protein
MKLPRNLLWWNHHKPVTASEIGRKGAQARIAKQRAPIIAKARQMRVELGMAPHSGLGR